ncbi:hypothetical protein [Gordonia lacunae]|uniref:Uncharacterized protein n=1 Tax=Gordonia lacunae TaxID=417102 RepID=A0A243Q8A0_9ACTN|nr:hypothetical protein [Gordonia lacunae]OUC77290.1 hypothetical protein CA982_17855 [Gordonia lacunae]
MHSIFTSYGDMNIEAYSIRPHKSPENGREREASIAVRLGTGGVAEGDRPVYLSFTIDEAQELADVLKNLSEAARRGEYSKSGDELIERRGKANRE